jgi:hypothetical protein
MMKKKIQTKRMEYGIGASRVSELHEHVALCCEVFDRCIGNISDQELSPFTEKEKS